MTRYPTPLHFDSSGSAIIRFAGIRLLDVGIHWIDRKISQLRMICPDTVDFVSDKPCLFCACDPDKIPNLAAKSISRGWDVHKGRWCLYMAPTSVMCRIAQQVEDAQFTEDTKDGMAPDVIIQRQRNETLTLLLEETVGEERGDGLQPPWEDYLRGLHSYSIWSKYARHSDVPERV